MRDSNYKSIALNRAAVSITTTLYDRRALDSTSDRPLVNSLNHLTFLTSSSAKVRETLATDGGLERLVSILHECKKDTSKYQNQKGKKTIAEEKNDAIIAWKWTLAFQCLVLIGTRGTEKIRKRVVEAGIVPIIATVLDNYLLIVRNFDNNIDNNLSENFLNLVNNNIQQQLQQSQMNIKQDDSFIDNDDEMEIRNYLNSNSELFNYLNEDYNNQSSSSSTPPANQSSTQTNSASATSPIHIIRNINDLNIQHNLQDINQTINSPRFFLNGILIPKEDDVVWSLQLLAFISKYSNLKDFLQFTHLVDPLSLRSLLNSSIQQQNSSIPPPLENDDLDNELEYELISNFSSDENDKNQQQHQNQRNNEPSNTQQTIEDPSSQIQPSTQPQTQPQSQPHTQHPSTQSSIVIQNSNASNDNIITDGDELLNAANEKPDLSPLVNLYSQSANASNSISEKELALNNNDKIKKSCFTKSLLNSILKYEHCCEKFSSSSSNYSSTSNISSPITSPLTSDIGQSSNEEKTLNLIELTIKLNKFYQRKCSLSKLAKIKKNITTRQSHESKWCYQTYFSQPCSVLSKSQSPDYDNSTKITNKINIFPLVEKFTIKSINSVDMCYWSGVIMRNSCRKDESRGGVRQCACFDCGKWESFPRQFAKCRRCKRTKYCSKECQLKAWVYHKHWCVDSNNSSSGAASGTNGGRGRDGDENSTANNPGPTTAGNTGAATTQLTENLNL